YGTVVRALSNLPVGRHPQKSRPPAPHGSTDSRNGVHSAASSSFGYWSEPRRLTSPGICCSSFFAGRLPCVFREAPLLSERNASCLCELLAEAAPFTRCSCSWCWRLR